MSKVSAMQAMREARYAAARTPRPAAAAAPVAPVAPARRGSTQTVDDATLQAQGAPDSTGAGEMLTPAAGPPAVGEAVTADGAAAAADGAAPAEEAPIEAEALCGHRSMNNRNCRRPAGHPEKNHRYN